MSEEHATWGGLQGILPLHDNCNVALLQRSLIELMGKCRLKEKLMSHGRMGAEKS